MFWPRYEEIPKIKIYLAKSISGLFSIGLWKDVIIITFFFALYYVLIIHATIPGSNQVVATCVVESWWLLNLVDTFFLGGALSNVSILSLGIFARFLYRIKMSMGQDFKKAKNIGKGEILVIAIFSTLVSIWYFQNRIIEYQLYRAGITFICIFAGSLMIRFIEIRLNQKDVSITHLFIIIIFIKYIQHNFKVGQPEKIAVLMVLSIMMSASLLFFSKRKILLPMWNVSGKYFEQSLFSIPIIGDKIVSNSFSMIAFYAIITMAFINFFGVLPKGQAVLSLPLITVIGLAYIVGYLILHLPESSRMLSRFNHVAISNGLKLEYWTFKHIKPGPETAKFLYNHYKKLIKRSYVYVSLSIFILTLTLGVYSFLPGQTVFFQHGLIGLMLFLPIFADFFSLIYLKIARYGGYRLTRYKWKYGISSGQTAEILNPSLDKSPLDLDSMLSSYLDKEDASNIKDLIGKADSRLELLKSVLSIVMAKAREEEEKLSFRKIILSFVQILSVGLMFSIMIFGFGVIVYQLFFPGAPLSPKDLFFLFIAFLAFWIPLSLSIFSLIHSNQLTRFIKRKS